MMDIFPISMGMDGHEVHVNAQLQLSFGNYNGNKKSNIL